VGGESRGLRRGAAPRSAVQRSGRSRELRLLLPCGRAARRVADCYFDGRRESGAGSAAAGRDRRATRFRNRRLAGATERGAPRGGRHSSSRRGAKATAPQAEHARDMRVAGVPRAEADQEGASVGKAANQRGCEVMTRAEAGKVYLVGAGPGDAELLTRRAAALLESADVVLHDDLVPHQILALA